MLGTAEKLLREAGFTKDALDELAALRYAQYADALADDRAFQRRYMVPVQVGTKSKPVELAEDFGVRPTTLEDLRRLKPVEDGGVVSFGSQPHPADGTAGFVVTAPSVARALGADGPLVEILATGFARAGRAEMPKAPVPAAQRALHDADLSFDELDAVQTHNPFAINDLWFARETGCNVEEMNPCGCSLVYGHPQGSTGQRGIIELAHILAERGGGIGLFTGCAAGDTGAAVVIRLAG